MRLELLPLRREMKGSGVDESETEEDLKEFLHLWRPCSLSQVLLGTERLQLLLDLFRGRVGHRGSVREDEGWDGAISTIDLLDDLSGAGDFFDIDLFEGDADIVELALETLAVSAPFCAVHREGHSATL